jgi:hypothetical protein
MISSVTLTDLTSHYFHHASAGTSKPTNYKMVNLDASLHGIQRVCQERVGEF